MSEIKKKIASNLKKGIDTDEVFVFALYISSDDPLATNKKYSRFLPITKVKVTKRRDDTSFSSLLPDEIILKTIASFTKYKKDGIELSKIKIPYDKFGSTPLEIFESYSEASNAYELKMVEAIEKIDKYKIKVDLFREKVLHSNRG